MTIAQEDHLLLLKEKVKYIFVIALSPVRLCIHIVQKFPIIEGVDRGEASPPPAPLPPPSRPLVSLLPSGAARASLALSFPLFPLPPFFLPSPSSRPSSPSSRPPLLPPPSPSPPPPSPLLPLPLTLSAPLY